MYLFGQGTTFCQSSLAVFTERAHLAGLGRDGERESCEARNGEGRLVFQGLVGGEGTRQWT